MQKLVSALASIPRLSPQGGQIKVDWTSLGRGTGVVSGYMVEYKGDPRGTFQRFG